MWKTKKFMVLTAVLVAVLIVGATAGIALAQDETGGKRGALIARVAEILGIDQQQIEDAFKQASQELREEARDKQLEDLVTSGKITQQEADEYKAWLESKPADIPMVPLRGLDKLVEEGVITQAQADEYTAWFESKPDVPIASYLRENKTDELFERLVENGTLTQEQVDEFRAWMESKPDVPLVRPDRLEQLVEEGVITQEQADAYEAWLEAKPDIPFPNARNQGGLPRTGSGHGFHQGLKGGLPGGNEGSIEPPTV